MQSVALSHRLHEPYFKLKGMSELERSLYVVEREYGLRIFGFCAALLERVPIVGLVFSISNRIGAAMLAHDSEKQQ
jgi:hypothetical protein